MSTTIVVPLDGSRLSESALPVAAAVAVRFDAGLVLVSAGWGSTAEDLHDYLETQASALGEGPVAATKVMTNRFPATAILDEVEAAPDAIVCMATHGRTGMGKALLGSVAEDLLVRTEHPVLLVGPRLDVRSDPTTGPIVVCCDGSDTSVSIVEVATRWAHDLELPVVVVAVTGSDGTVVRGESPARMDAVLSGIADRMRTSGLEVRREILVGENAATAIEEFAASSSAAMIAMATHGRTGIARTAMGSVAMRVVRSSTCPVLVVRPHSD